MNIFYAVVDAIKDNVRALSNKRKHHEPVQEKSEDAAVLAAEAIIDHVDLSLLTEELKEKEALIAKNLVKTKELKEAKADLEIKYQGLNEKYSKLSVDFSETTKRKDIVEADLLDTQEKLRQETEKVEAFQNSIKDNDIMITEMSEKKKQAEIDLKTAQTELTKLKKTVVPKTV